MLSLAGSLVPWGRISVRYWGLVGLVEKGGDGLWKVGGVVCCRLFLRGGV